MPSVETLAAAVRAAIAQNRDLIARLGASREQAAEFRDELGALGVEAKAAQAGSIVDSLEEMQAEASGITAELESALATTEAIRTDAAGGGGGGTPPGPPPAPAAPPDLGSTGYPVGKPHPISWSDLYHVVNGDDDNPEKGGHVFGTGRPGKTEFPEGWDDEDISEALAAVAARPSKVRPSGRNFMVEGTHRGVTILAIVRPDGSISAGWPVRGPGVKRNLGGR